MNRVGLSVNLIVKNEEKFLAAALESIKTIADEIILVDTGSTDTTISIAEKYNCNIYHFNWVNDFSAARNYALSKSSYSYILYIDADERLNIDSIGELEKIINNPFIQAWYCTVKNIDNKNGVPKFSKYPRLFPNNPGVRFNGRVHEQIEDSLTKLGYTFGNSKIVIDHLGYDVDVTVLKDKATRNLKLLIDDYRDTNSAYTAYQVANTFAIMEQTMDAERYYRKALEYSDLNNAYRAVCYGYLAGTAFKRSEFEDAIKHINNAIKYNSKDPYLLLQACEFYLAIKNNREALIFITEAYKSNNEVLKSSGTNLISQGIEKNKLLAKLYYVLIINNSIDELKKIVLQELSFPVSQLLKSLFSGAKLKATEVNRFITERNIVEMLELLPLVLDKMLFVDVLILLSEKTKNSVVEYKLAEILIEQGKYPEAKYHLNKSLKLDVNNPVVWFFLISSEVSTGNINKAKSLINEAKRQFINLPNIHSKLTSIENKLS